MRAMNSSTTLKILAGDVGGTNTRLAVFNLEPSGRLVQQGEPTRYRNREYKSLADIVGQYVASAPRLDAACFGLAGPVASRRVTLTNVHHWPVIDADELAGVIKLPDTSRLTLVNDMVAHSAAIEAVELSFPDQISPIRDVPARAKATRAIVMPGTGLGIASMIWDERVGAYQPQPSEGGNLDLPARDEFQTKLVDSLRIHMRQKGERSVFREAAISGPGLRAIYACLKNPANPDVESAPPAEKLRELESSDALAKQTLDTFVSLLGALCGNVAVDYLPFGGIYVAGGIANSLADRLRSPMFVEPFLQTGPIKYDSLLKSFRVSLISFEDTGLVGAAGYKSRRMEIA